MSELSDMSPEKIALGIVEQFSWQSNVMQEGQLVGQQYVVAGAIAKAIQDERDRFRDLMWKAVRNCRSPHYRKYQKHERWIAVMHTFAAGSNQAHALCREFGTNPDDLVSR